MRACEVCVEKRRKNSCSNDFCDFPVSECCAGKTLTIPPRSLKAPLDITCENYIANTFQCERIRAEGNFIPIGLNRYSKISSTTEQWLFHWGCVGMYTGNRTCARNLRVENFSHTTYLYLWGCLKYPLRLKLTYHNFRSYQIKNFDNIKRFFSYTF